MKVMKILSSVVLLLAAAGILMAAVYTYKCPACGLIQQYDRIGAYKCPKDGFFMVLQR